MNCAEKLLEPTIFFNLYTEESKVANRDWVDYQACSLLQYINVIANLLEESKVANRDWVDYQACSLLQYINVIANLLEESKVANRDWVDFQACSLLQYINVIANLLQRRGRVFACRSSDLGSISGWGR